MTPEDEDGDRGELVPLDTEPVAGLTVAWFTTDTGERLAYELNVSGEATDRQWLVATLMQLAASIAREGWDWEEGEPGDDDPGPGDALPFVRPVTPAASSLVQRSESEAG